MTGILIGLIIQIKLLDMNGLKGELFINKKHPANHCSDQQDVFLRMLPFETRHFNYSDLRRKSQNSLVSIWNVTCSMYCPKGGLI